MLDTLPIEPAAAPAANKNDYENVGQLESRSRTSADTLVRRISPGSGFCCRPGTLASAVTQEFKVVPLRMTYDDLDSLLVGIRRLVEKANTGVAADDLDVRLQTLFPTRN
jgi:hypothetical protein